MEVEADIPVVEAAALALPHITVRVIPFTAGAFPGAGDTVELAEGPVAQLDFVSVDTEQGSAFPCSDAQLASHRRFMERFETIALEPDASRDVILAIIGTLCGGPMRPDSWQKSSFSSEGSAFLELAVAPPGDALLIRESDEPGTALRTNPARLRALLGLVRQDTPH